MLTDEEMAALLDVIAFDCSSPSAAPADDYQWTFEDPWPLEMSRSNLRYARHRLARLSS